MCIKNRSARDSYKALQNFWGSNRIRTHDLRDTGAMLYQLSYEASPEAGQVRIQFIPVVWRDAYDKNNMSELRIKNRSERDLRSCEVT